MRLSPNDVCTSSTLNFLAVVSSSRGEPGLLAAGGPMVGGGVWLGGREEERERWRVMVGLVPSASLVSSETGTLGGLKIRLRAAMYCTTMYL